MLRKIKLLLLGSIFCLQTFLFGQVNITKPVFISTDAGMSDLMAILYLVNHPNIDIKGIVTVGDGITNWEYGAKNIQNLLQLAGHPKIPVAYGERESMSPVGSIPYLLRKKADNVYGVKLPHNPYQSSRLPGTELLIQTLRNYPDKMTLISLGPLTSIAKALQEDPSIKEKIDQIYIMGGAIHVLGNVEGKSEGYSHNLSEYNIYLDAKAASIVFESGVPITLVPLDVTNTVPITTAFYRNLSDLKQTQETKFLLNVLKPYALTGGRTVYFWDPLTAVLVTNPNVATYKTLSLQVNQTYTPNYGRTIVTKKGNNIQVAIKVHSKQFYQIFLQAFQ